MLTGNEPVSVGNMLAVAAAYPRKTGLVAYGESMKMRINARGTKEIHEMPFTEFPKFAEAGFSVSSCTASPRIPGIYAVTVELIASLHLSSGSGYSSAKYGLYIKSGDLTLYSPEVYEFRSFNGGSVSTIVPIGAGGLSAGIYGACEYGFEFVGDMDVSKLRIAIIES